MPRPIKPAKTLELAAAEAAVQQFLLARDYAGAARAVAAYEAKQPTPRGIGMDWAHHDVRGDVAGLTSIYSSSELEVILHAAAQMYLWGVSRPYRRWLAADVQGDARASALVMAAYKAQQAFHNADANKRFGFSLPE